jgi:hypothetical protein
MLSISGNGRACNPAHGFFDVRQIVYDAAGVARRLHVLFEYHCEGAAPALTGEVRIDADTTVLLNVPLRTRARRGQQLELDVTAVHAAGLPLTVSTGPLPAGASFDDHGDGTGRLLWTPDITQQGDFEVAFSATDGVGGSGVGHTLVRVDGDTLLDAISEPGDRAWLERSCRLRPGDMRVIADAPDGTSAGVQFLPYDPGVGPRNFSITPARRGNYSLLRRWSEDFFATGSFVAYPAPGSCGAVETHYRVRQVELAQSVFTALWMEWEQHCDGEVPAFQGEMRVNAGSPIVVRAPIARRVHYGDTLRLDVSGRDTLGRPLVLSASQLPPGSIFTSTSPTTSILTWCPSVASAGPHTLMFSASNAAGEADTVTTDVVVTGDVSARVVSELGDPAGDGASVNYHGAPGTLLTSALMGDPFLGTSDLIKLHESGRAWEIKIRGPVPGTAISSGRYSLSWPPVVSGVYFHGKNTAGRSAEWFSADFRLRQVQRTPSGNLIRFWLQFEQRSEDRMPILSGDIRVDARWNVFARAPLRRAASSLQPLAFDIEGETPDGETPSVSALDLPPGASLDPIAPGRARFHWVPEETDVGLPRTVRFVATRADGRADTAFTILEVLRSGVLHLEENGRTWDLHSGLGQFRSRGSVWWARATFSSPAADTVWSMEVAAGYPDTLVARSYVMEEWNEGPSICVAVPGLTYASCDRDTGHFDVTRLAAEPSGAPSELWVDFVQRGTHGPEDMRAGWFRFGNAGTLSAPNPPELPTTFECSQFLPNPAAHPQRLELRLPGAGRVAMTVFDLGGRRVREHDWGVLEAGRHTLRPPDLGALSPGLYLVRIEYAGTAVTRRLGLLR